MNGFMTVRRFNDTARTGCIARWLFVFWLVGTAVIPAAFGLMSPAVRFVALVWPVPLLLLLGRRRSILAPAFVQRPWRILGAALIIASACISATVSPDRKLSLEMTLATLVAILICAGFWAIIGNDDSSLLGTYAWASLVVCLVALVTVRGTMGGDRLSFAGLDPNPVGLILQGVTISSLAIRRLPFRAVAVLLSLYVMYLTNSRSALIGTAIALLLYFVLRGRTLFAWSLAAVLSVSGVIVASGSDYLSKIADQTSQVLHLHNKYRGLNSGFTGRALLWQETIDIWHEHPLIGSGYRAIEELIPQGMSSHDGYLEILGETGIFGALSMALFSFQGIRGLISDSRKGSQVAQLGLALTAGYLFIAVFERYFVNFGNPTSLLVLCMWMRPTVTPGLGRGKLLYKITRGDIPGSPVVAYVYARNPHFLPLSKS